MDESGSLFESLSDEGRELVPVSLRLMSGPGDETEDPRTVESAHHRARGYHCYVFHKPISRCLPTRRP